MNPAVLSFIDWLVGQGIPCTGYTSITGNGSTHWPPSSITLTFDSSATQDQINQAYGLVNSFVYVPPIPPPDPKQFQSLILASPDIPLPAKANLMQYFASLEQHANNPPGLQAGWQVLIAVYGETWLTQDIRTIVENYASQTNMPISIGK